MRVPAPLRSWPANAFGLLAICSIGWGIYRALTSSNDLMTRLAEWHYLASRWGELTGWRAPYLPVTYALLTPWVWMPLPVARSLFLCVNLACLLYVWRRVTELYELNETDRWLWLALFGSWACVRVTLGSGQLGLVCLAVVLWAFPFHRRWDAARLGLSTVKHTLAYPVWLWLLWRAPRQLWATGVAMVVPFLLVVVLNPVPLNQFVQTTVRAAEKMVVQWDGGTSLLSALRITWPQWQGSYFVVAGLWGILFIWSVRRIRDERLLVATLLLMSLWPFYHRPYDFVIAGPFLAMLMGQRQRAAALALTLAALGWYERLDSLRFLGMEWLRVAASWYYPVMILACLGWTAWRLHNDPTRWLRSPTERANNR